MDKSNLEAIEGMTSRRSYMMEASLMAEINQEREVPKGKNAELAAKAPHIREDKEKFKIAKRRNTE